MVYIIGMTARRIEAEECVIGFGEMLPRDEFLIRAVNNQLFIMLSNEGVSNQLWDEIIRDVQGLPEDILVYLDTDGEGLSLGIAFEIKDGEYLQ